MRAAFLVLLFVGVTLALKSDNELRRAALMGAPISEEEANRLFPDRFEATATLTRETPLTVDEYHQHVLAFIQENERLKEEYHFKYKLPKDHVLATNVVLMGNQKKKTAADSDSGPGVDLSGVYRECPHYPCPVNTQCPMKGGVCCKASQMCCPTGASCLTTFPLTTCVFESPDDTNRCSQSQCAYGHECPEKEVGSCCAGGMTCCPKGYSCKATRPPLCKKDSPALAKYKLGVEKHMAEVKKREKERVEEKKREQKELEKKQEIATKVADKEAQLENEKKVAEMKKKTSS